MRLDLPALDLPVSRTGLALHYSPRFRVDPEPGSFRVETDPGPFAEALRAAEARPLAAPSPPPPPRPTRERDERAAADLQALADRFTSDRGTRLVAGALPIH